jgi:Tol biopolymer transport system component
VPASPPFGSYLSHIQGTIRRAKLRLEDGHERYPGVGFSLASQQHPGVEQTIGIRPRVALGGFCVLILSVIVVAGSALAFHPRPKGATPQLVSLAVAYRECIDNPKIAFQSNRDGNDEIYAMAEGGSGQTRLTNNPASDFRPSWSPAGDKIAFTSNRDGNNEIYVMNADGTGVARLTNDPANDRQPTWSINRRIAFTSDRTGDDEIFTMDESGFNVSNVTQNAAQDTNPNWWGQFGSANTDIIFQSDRDGNDEIYRVTGTGSATRLTNEPAHDGGPAWSTINGSIAFDSTRDGNAEIYKMSSTGGSQQRLTFSSLTESNPAWSPDDQKIAFEQGGGTSTNFEIYSMSANGGGVTNLTNNSSGDDRSPDWQFKFVNRQHAPPLAGLSCSLLRQESSYLTVGTADSWAGTVARLAGTVRFDVKTSSPEDIKIVANMTDVRCRGNSVPGLCSNANPDNASVPDYAGTLRATATTRLTDHYNGTVGGGFFPDPATTQDFEYGFDVPCTVTPSTTTIVGSNCDVTTTANTLVAGTVIDNKRVIWQSGQAQVLDGGADGDGSTLTGNTVFLRQGLFVP